MCRHALVVATISGFIKPFEMNDISILQEMGYIVHIATKMSPEDYEFFEQKGVIVHHIEFERNPLKFSNFKAIRIIQNIIEKNNIEVVHCHTPVGGVMARLAAKKFRKKGCKVIYTVHGLQFYNGSPKKDWLMYYPVEKFLSRFTDAIITINHEDCKRVSEKFNNNRTYYIPGVGVDLDKFGDIQIDKQKKKNELGIGNDDIVLLSVGELIPRKNHQVVIKAISKINDLRVKYFIAGTGPLKETLDQTIKEFGLENRVFLLGYRTDVKELLECTDIFVLPSRQEGLSVALMESMAGALPVVCSRIRGNIDLIDEGKGGYLCSVSESDEYAEAIRKLVDDLSLCKKMGEYNQQKMNGFSISVVDQKMRCIYQELLKNPVILKNKG